MKTKAETNAQVTAMVIAKANARKITLDSYSLGWIVTTLMLDIACKFSESRMHRHMNSMLTRVKTQVRG